MPERQPLLIEVGTEEMPVGVSVDLAKALHEEIALLLGNHDFAPEKLSWGATPRRLLVHSSACHTEQPDFDEEIWGPPEKVAYADDRSPTKAAAGFAKKVGLPLDAFTLADKGDGKGRYMRAVVHRKGAKAIDVLSKALPEILHKLPSPKQMKWQEGASRNDAFIRPIRWIVARLGDETVPFNYGGVASGSISHGHRVHGGSGEIDIYDPFGWLERQHVRANWQERRRRIDDAIRQLTGAVGLAAVEDEALLAEVTDLTEWPVPMLAAFDDAYLRLPPEVIRIVLKQHQRCFTTVHATDGSLANTFVTIANIESRQPEKVVEGNARVVNARLADAAFYFDRDPRESLAARVAKLANVAYQEGLGSLHDQAKRLCDLAPWIGERMPTDNPEAFVAHVRRAALLCKADLTTGMVYEFPELQGYMGGVYAGMDGEDAEVCTGIAQHYRPAGAEDALPDSAVAMAIAIAERSDQLLGYFQLGLTPTAAADPYGLRRAAYGLIRLLLAARPLFTVAELLEHAARVWSKQGVIIHDAAMAQAADFIHERFRHHCLGAGISGTAVDAALASTLPRPLAEVWTVADLLAGFAESAEGQAAAAANKRVANILKQAGTQHLPGIRTELFAEAAESALHAALTKCEDELARTLEPEAMLAALARLRQPVDRFFDDVLVMCEQPELRLNRLALLAHLRHLFLKLADFSRLPG